MKSKYFTEEIIVKKGRNEHEWLHNTRCGINVSIMTLIWRLKIIIFWLNIAFTFMTIYVCSKWKHWSTPPPHTVFSSLYTFVLESYVSNPINFLIFSLIFILVVFLLSFPFMACKCHSDRIPDRVLSLFLYRTPPPHFPLSTCTNDKYVSRSIDTFIHIFLSLTCRSQSLSLSLSLHYSFISFHPFFPFPSLLLSLASFLLRPGRVPVRSHKKSRANCKHWSRMIIQGGSRMWSARVVLLEDIWLRDIDDDAWLLGYTLNGIAGETKAAEERVEASVYLWTCVYLSMCVPLSFKCIRTHTCACVYVRVNERASVIER